MTGEWLGVKEEKEKLVIKVNKFYLIFLSWKLIDINNANIK